MPRIGTLEWSVGPASPQGDGSEAERPTLGVTAVDHVGLHAAPTREGTGDDQDLVVDLVARPRAHAPVAVDLDRLPVAVVLFEIVLTV